MTLLVNINFVKDYSSSNWTQLIFVIISSPLSLHVDRYKAGQTIFIDLNIKAIYINGVFWTMTFSFRLNHNIKFCFSSNNETVNFRQFMRVLARFRPTKSNQNKNKLNTREEKLKCLYTKFSLFLSLSLTLSLFNHSLQSDHLF